MKKGKGVGNKVKLSNHVRLTLILLSIIIIAIGSGNLLKSCTNKTDVTIEGKELYKYDNAFNSKSKINLKSNSYVQEDEMTDDQTYLSDLISSIDMDINYNYKASIPSQIMYSYKIEAVMKATYTNTKSTYDVLNKVDVIKEENATTETTNDFSINEKVSIDYEKYHQTMKEFKQQMGITADSQLYIRFTINTKTNVNSKDVDNEYVSNYKISLGDKVALIEEPKDDTTTKSIKTDEQKIQKTNVDIKDLIFNVVLIGVGLIIAIYTFTRTEELKSIRNEFKLELNRILKSYEDKIVEVQDLNNFNMTNATRVKDILQLRKLAEEELVPIYCYLKEDEAYFIVTKYNNNYVYILK